MNSISKKLLILIAAAIGAAQAPVSAGIPQQESPRDSLATPAERVGIAFEDISLDEALARASVEGKMVFVDCYIQTCGPCKFMARNVFPQKECGDYMNPRFVSVMKDLEVEGEGVEIARKYGVVIYPTFLLLNPDGSLFYKIEGGASKKPAQFLPKIENALIVGEMNRRYDGGDRSDAFMAEYTSKLSRSDLRRLRQVLDEYIPSKSAAELGDSTVWSIIKRGISTTASAAFRHVFDNRQALVDRLGKKEVDTKIMMTYYTDIQRYRRSNFDFSPMIADMRLLEAEDVEGAYPTRLSMLFRQAINAGDRSRVDSIIAMVREADGRVDSESVKAIMLRDLSGIENIATPAQLSRLRRAIAPILARMTPHSVAHLRRALPFLN